MVRKFHLDAPNRKEHLLVCFRLIEPGRRRDAVHLLQEVVTQMALQEE